jgi:DNA-damage-inducible protein J
METTSLHMRVDKKLKEDAEDLFSQLGFTMTTAINAFLREAVRERRMPLELSLNDWTGHNQSAHIPNAETLAAMAEIEDMKAGKLPKDSRNLNELFADFDIESE